MLITVVFQLSQLELEFKVFGLYWRARSVLSDKTRSTKSTLTTFITALNHNFIPLDERNSAYDYRDY